MTNGEAKTPDIGNPDVLGRLEDGRKVLYLRQHVGEASYVPPEGSDSPEDVYELATLMDGSPFVRCKRTNRIYRLEWKMILDLAIEKGISGE